jgi:RNA polymerase sigma factor (sigma-70 family)
MERALQRAASRPAREDAEPAVVELLRRHGGRLMSVARRYSSSREDAEDAYQRAVEILLTRAPSTDAAELLPWMKTVVKHEAFAVGRQRARHGTPSEVDWIEPFAGLASGPAEVAERRDRLRLGAEALGRLKPQEARALLLRAEGLSYREICAATGWSYTKVNRCLSEGRRSFLDRVDGIEGGDECQRLRPLVSALADGEASGRDLRPHLSGCLVCRARLREYRRAPAAVAAAVVPAGAAAALWGSLRGAAHAAAARAHDAAGAAVQCAAGPKAAAVAASGVLLAGGGAATVRVLDPPSAPTPHRTGRAPAPAPRRPRVVPTLRQRPDPVARLRLHPGPRPRPKLHRRPVSPSVPIQGEFTPTAAVKGGTAPGTPARFPARSAPPAARAAPPGEGGEFAP